MNISVIIPAFNAADTIAETLDSVHMQSYQAMEIIVIDDGSADQTAQIARKHNSEPKVISSSNQGAASALNTGIGSALGDLIAFVDADDLWHKSKLEMQSAILRDNPETGLVFSYMEAFLCPSVSPEVARRLVYPQGPQPGYVIGTLMTRRSIFEQNGVLDTALKTGYFIDWFSRVDSEGIKYSILTHTHLKRRVRQGTLGQRRINENGGLSSDFIEIARRAINRKRNSITGNS